MALDNPTYFTLASKSESNRMGNTPSTADTASTSSETSLRQCSPPSSATSKKTVRHLLRSVSSNSADSNQELLIMGQPRLSDIAPDLTAFSAYSHNNEPRRSNSLKHTKRGEFLYDPLPTSEDAAGQLSEDEEVFLNEETARYCNFAAMHGNNTANRRRHSIGTVMGRERTLSLTSSNVNFKEDFPQAILHTTPNGSAVHPATSIFIDDHSMRHSSYPRKRCNRCTRGPAQNAHDMDDILIISAKNSEPAALWVEYFTSYFEHFSRQGNRRPFKVHHLTIEDVLESNGDIRFISEKTAAVKLQLIVLCPLFLEQIVKHFAKVSVLTKILYPNRILALLLGVTDDDVLDIHKNVLTTYSQWQRLRVGEDQDENFTKEFLETAMTIFTRVWKQQSYISAQEKSHFSVSPKKIRQGQNSVLILLTHPLQKEDIVKISIERNNEIVEVANVKKRNPYTLKISIPDSLTEVSAIVNILVEKNGNVIGSRPIKCESRLRELEQILRSISNPVEFMCQTLGFSPHDKVQLDNWMVHMLQKKLPYNFNIFCNDTIYTGKELKQSCGEFPTLLHFAAKYGLEKLSMQLLDCPGGDTACEIRNCNDCVPADIAEYEGFTELGQMLRGYMKMYEFSKMYTKLKEISLNPEKIAEVDEDYLTPKEIDTTYKICPPPKPVNVLSTSNPELSQETGYIAMNSSAHLRSITPTTVEPPPKLTTASSNSNINVSSLKMPPAVKDALVTEDKVQKELLEIINDFKNNVHSIAQAEKLVEEWKNRNDVQKSFKEKSEQLNEMRMKYEKIQQDMKGDSVKFTPFERVKKLFTWGKSKDNKKVMEKIAPEQVPLNARPISSLSIQSTSSSASSGRMSTISGCSLGDSGTHSDHEDRKNLINSSPEDDLKNVMYMIPPAPRPVHPGMFPNKNMFPPIEERPPQPIPRLVEEEYYIQFPPSGLPVQSKFSVPNENDEYLECDSKLAFRHGRSPSPRPTAAPNTEYMNLCATLNSPTSCPEYMNFGPPSALVSKK